MYSKEKEIEGLEHQLKGIKAARAYAEDVRKLMGNSLFRKVILEQFCTVDCARYVQESCDPLLEDRQRADALAMAQAAGCLKRYLEITLQKAETLVGVQSDIENALDVARGEPEEV
ncbi:gp58 [Escherichia phage N4]|uniref:Gp58 n=5 Tax=Enquatrovirus N4 TaxID=10752 RepID=A0MZE0_BPN4|nr:gp58 [Escherichia phage N4]AUV59062.1 hypothetical protein [Escherichia phage PMBT57]AYR04242.1 hypothetical protein [Escherichia phage OLB145]QDF14956.1 hypothetical protein AC3HA13_580 [Escherichia phage vB_EcoP_3HA13]QPN96328.1 hypothetical protein vec25_62 [Escherichia phage VEc25]QXV75785.1 hypothetical protein bas69_0013 [Escherichia phage AlfredRasser]CAE6410265.1 gp58 [Escherichia phage vB_Eco_Jura]CAH0462304.1 gp58 [Escherichia phage N4] [Escherichia phage vB_Eco_SPSP]CAH6421878